MALVATYLGANGWILDFERTRVLVDPWITGTLEFPPGRWFFRGELPRERPVPDRVDLLLITQSLADHCHPASLALLPRDLEVVASPAAARPLRQLGFTSVIPLAPGETFSRLELKITATAGAGVPHLENGYLIDHPAGSLYLEPHGFLQGDLEERSVDAVITPVVDLGLPVVGAFVRGRQVLPELLERFRPRTILASTTGGEVRFDGLLTRVLWQAGSTAEAEAAIRRWSGRCHLIDPVPGTPYGLPAG
jgi:L-ascorbate metabolism protein UlaG (beta-lactamase superfamily)